MGHIMCSQTLWRRLGQPGRPPLAADAVPLHGSVLGNWAAKVFRDSRRDLVLALNERTYLTLVFPLAPRKAFRAHFAQALTWALEDLGVPEQSRFVECAAVEYVPLTRLTSRSMTGSLNDLEFHCGIELSYHADLRRVQLNLNEVPHANRDPCVPIEAVVSLFQEAARRRGPDLLRPH